MWNAFRHEDEDIAKFIYEESPDSFANEAMPVRTNNCIIPYGDSPLDDELTGQNIYLEIINQAQDYVYIFTPYLIIDNDMINALTLAAKRGG